jgi:hypothetical protein
MTSLSTLLSSRDAKRSSLTKEEGLDLLAFRRGPITLHVTRRYLSAFSLVVHAFFGCHVCRSSVSSRHRYWSHPRIYAFKVAMPTDKADYFHIDQNRLISGTSLTEGNEK